MKKILFITEHPAPYWDKTFRTLEKQVDITVLYIDHKVKSKPWNNYEPFYGKYYVNPVKLIKLLINHDTIVIGGYYRIELRISMFFSFLLFKKTHLFSDVSSDRKRNFIMIMLKSILYKFFDKILVSGKKGIEIFNLTYGVKKSKLLYFPYAWEFKKNISNVNNFSRNRLNVLICNRFILRKGHNVLLSALESCSEKLLDSFHFTFIGDGELKDQTVEGLKRIPNLMFDVKGWVDFEVYKKILSKSDVMIHSSLFEPYGIPVLDALNQGLIVIISDGVMSGYDFVENEVNGFIYPAKSSSELKNRLKYIADNRSSLKKISDNAKLTLPEYKSLIKTAVERI